MTTLRIPGGRLPQDAASRHAALRNYFCDKDAEAEPTGTGWALRLAWPGGPDRHVDPLLNVGLDWWGDNVRPEAMALAHRRRGRILSALYDTWTLHSWSEWLATQRPPPDTSVRILHVDDHRDLMSPRLVVENGRWRDLITGEPCVLDEPETVEAALRSGALGMGSFMTPFLHRFPRSEVRHLCQPPKAQTTRDFAYAATTQADDLLEPGVPRPAINLAPTDGIPGAGTYRHTPHLEDWLENLGEGPVLLHIDMDYFNNRYDGDSNWSTVPEPLDPDVSEVLARIDAMAGALERTGVGARLEDVVIAYSPGFFPAELWEPAGERLRHRLEALHG